MSVKLKFRGPRQTLRKEPQNIATAKGRFGNKWIEEINIFHILIYELNSWT